MDRLKDAEQPGQIEFEDADVEVLTAAVNSYEFPGVDQHFLDMAEALAASKGSSSSVTG